MPSSQALLSTTFAVLPDMVSCLDQKKHAEVTHFAGPTTKGADKELAGQLLALSIQCVHTSVICHSHSTYVKLTLQPLGVQLVIGETRHKLTPSAPK